MESTKAQVKQPSHLLHHKGDLKMSIGKIRNIGGNSGGGTEILTPEMTSATLPYGVVTSNLTAYSDKYKIFYTIGYRSDALSFIDNFSQQSGYIRYMFEKPAKISKIAISLSAENHTSIRKCQLQYIDLDNNLITAYSFDFKPSKLYEWESFGVVLNNIEAKGIQLYIESNATYVMGFVALGRYI